MVPRVVSVFGSGSKNGSELEIACPEEVHSRYYVRMRVDDRPGVMAEIASILASREVSLAKA